jgi:cyclopropane fatty-acyl-phospholipid synthase-like methyltransferase
MIDLLVIIVSLVFLVLFLTSIISVLYGAPYVVTDKETLEKIVNLVDIKKNTKVVDLGSGDGRIVIAFAKRGVEAHGFEVNPFLVALSKINIRRKGLSNNAFIHWKNFWRQDLSKFNVVVFYGITHVMFELEQKLKEELKKGALVITHSYKLPNWNHSKKVGAIYLYKRQYGIKERN